MWFKKKKKKVERKPPLKKQLIDARATLAKYELLPESDFTIPPSQFYPFPKHGVDEKPKAIARAKAKVAELEERLKGIKGGTI